MIFRITTNGTKFRVEHSGRGFFWKASRYYESFQGKEKLAEYSCTAKLAIFDTLNEACELMAEFLEINPNGSGGDFKTVVKTSKELLAELKK